MGCECSFPLSDSFSHLRYLHSRFLWADLQIKSLLKLKSRATIKGNLGKLPETLATTYSNICEKVFGGKSTEPEVAKKALMWLMCSQHSLSPQEWVDVTYWPNKMDQDTATYQLHEMCQNLVAVDKQSQVVRFAHLSVQEYLESLDDFTTEKANSMAANFCLSVLLSDQTSISTTALAYDYSVRYWMGHVSKCTGSQDVLNLMQTFLGTAAKPGKTYCNWFRIAMEASKSATSDDTRHCFHPALGCICFRCLMHLDSEPLNPVYAVCFFHLGMRFQDFWEQDKFDINSRNKYGGTLLFVAIMGGNEQIVESLLELGADVNIPCKEGVSWKKDDIKAPPNPLSAAIIKRRPQIAVKLLGSGARIYFGAGEPDIVPLEFAAKFGDPSVVKAITNWGGFNTEVTETVLVAAARNRFHSAEILEMLLAKTFLITEAILIAVAEAGNKSLDLLLTRIKESNTVITVTDDLLKTAVYIYNGNLLDMLLAQARESNVKIPVTVELLGAAVTKGNEESLEMLLMAENSANYITEDVLVRAAKRASVGGLNALKMLLKKDPALQITEEILIEAARNDTNGSAALEMLLSRNIEITEGILMAVAVNHKQPGIAENVLARNIEKPNIKVNLTALKASASFAFQLLFQAMLHKYSKSSLTILTEKFVYTQLCYAAVQGGNGNILRSLDNLRGDLLGTDKHGWTLQMVKRQSSKESNGTHDGIEAPKQSGVRAAHCAQIQLSPPTGWDDSNLPGDIKPLRDGSFIFFLGRYPTPFFIPLLWY